MVTDIRSKSCLWQGRGRRGLGGLWKCSRLYCGGAHIGIPITMEALLVTEE